MTALAAAVLADVWPYHHDDAVTGSWPFMMLAMLIVTVAVIALAVWAVRGGLGPGQGDAAQELLRKRLADGSISIEEYEQRRDVLGT